MDQLERIVVGLDFSREAETLTDGSRAAARQAFWLAARTGARIDLVHSTYRGSEDGPLGYDRARMAEIVDELRNEHADHAEASPLILTEERPWVALTRRVLQNEGDLVVVAKRNHSKRDDRKLGSESMKLIRKCPAPVWVIKPEQHVQHRCVVAANDLSPVGDLATDYGAFIAQASDCDLYVVHAWQVPMELQLGAARTSPRDAAQERQAIAEAAKQHILQMPSVAELGPRSHLFLTCDSPSHAITQLADEKQPDLVVMGTLSRSGIAGMLIGNTAEKLLYQLDSSLLTVKPKDFVCPLEIERS